MVDLPVVLISAFTGAIVSYVGSIIAIAAESRKRIDESLRDRRLESYARLWQQMVLVPKWPRARDLTYEKLAELCAWFRDWYFSDGGMIMSRKTTDAYRQLQTALGALIDADKRGTGLPKW